MIVADTNTIAYLFFTGEHTSEAEMVMEKDSDWVAPILWRSEFRNVIANYLRRGLLTLVQALQIAEQAEFLMMGNEFEITSSRVLSLVSTSNCSAYDCEFVALAQELGAPLVTSDLRILAEFSSVAVSPRAFVSGAQSR
ncbi:MAG: type II toxin-antitoxin system VapC family toxin [Syntrophobacteraceae bacterium]